MARRMTDRFKPFATGLFVLALSFDGCASSTAPLGTPGVLPVVRTAEAGARAPTNLYAASFQCRTRNYNSCVIEYSGGGPSIVRTVSNLIDTPEALAFDQAGNLYVANRNYNAATIYASGHTNVKRTISVGINAPDDLAFDSAGNLYVANSGRSNSAE